MTAVLRFLDQVPSGEGRPYAAELTEEFHQLSRRVLVMRWTGNPMSREVMPYIRIAIISVVPLCLNVVLLETFPKQSVSGTAWAWLSYFAGLQIYLLCAIRWLFFQCLSAMPFIDCLLPQRDRITGQRLLRIAASTLMQMTASLLVSTTLCVALALMAPALDPRLEIGPASYLTLALAAFIGMNGGYWIISILLLFRAVHQSSPVAVRRIDPLRTPAILVIVRTSNAGAMLTLIAFVLFELPLAATLALAPKNHVVILTNVLAPLFALIFVLAVMIFPHYYFSGLVSREKARTLQIISTGQAADVAYQDLRFVSEFVHEVRRLGFAEQLQLYSITSSMPDTTYSKAALAQMGLAVIAIALPYIAQGIFHFITH
jgi:hypothetical protein